MAVTRHADADWRLGRPVGHGLAHLLVVGDGLDEVLAQVVRVVHNGCAEDLIIYHVDGIGELAKQRPHIQPRRLGQRLGIRSI